MTRQRTTTLVSVPDHEIELELSNNTDQHESDMFFHVTDEVVIVGYLIHDDDCSSPEEGDGQGKIYTSARSATREHHDGFCQALGLNSDFRQNFDLCDPHKVLKFIGEDTKLSYAGTKDETLYQLLLEYFNNYCERNEEEPRLDFVLRCLEHSELDELTEFLDLDPYLTAAWAEGKLEGKIGEKYAVMLDVYEHGGISYSVSGEGMQCAFDTARGGAVWVPDDCAVENFEDKNLSYEDNFKKAQAYARTCVEEYTKWANGECYGICVEKHWRESGDSQELTTVWGHIGQEYAQEACKEEFDYYVKKENENGTES